MDSYPLSKVRSAINLAKKTGVTVQTALWVVDPDPQRQEANLARLQAAGLDVGPGPGSSPHLRDMDLPLDSIESSASIAQKIAKKLGDAA